ncbi:MAG: tRNA (guanine-N1)-methyltransferase [Bacteroidetes bacterium]|nr:MAG: tRNA (guanine-N1)-methyltransferase [Bacteroidota bacterium]
MKAVIKLLSLIIILVLSGAIVNTMAQETETKPSLNSGTIESQFNYLITKSNRYEAFKVVKESWLYKIKKNVSDSLNVIQTTLRETQKRETVNQNEIQSLNSELKQTREKLTQAIKEKNSIRFVGVPMNKNGYKSLVWTIIAGLTAGIVILFLMFRRSHSVTTRMKNDLEETKEELEAFRRRALERESQLARELHDEINHYKAELNKYKK